MNGWKACLIVYGPILGGLALLTCAYILERIDNRKREAEIEELERMWEDSHESR